MSRTVVVNSSEYLSKETHLKLEREIQSSPGDRILILDPKFRIQVIPSE